MLQITSLTYHYPDERWPAIDGISLRVEPGECLCLTGHSGCGKTTLLLAIKGLLHEGALQGEIRIELPDDHADTHSDRIGIVFQNAETQILCSTVAEEIAFGPENLRVPDGEISGRIEQALEAVNLGGFERRNVERLSAGQKHRLAIASVLAMQPRILLLDEPTSQLDAVSKAELVQVLKTLKRKGYTILIAEHNLEPFADLADRYLVMKGGRIVRESAAIPLIFKTENQAWGPELRKTGNEEQPVINAERLCLTYPDAGRVLREFFLQIQSGERIYLSGRNGSGKSSLLRCLTGIMEPDSGSIRIAGKAVAAYGSLLGTVGYLFQNPQRQLFENTVHEEIAFSLKRLRLPKDEIEQRITNALIACEADHLRDRLPLSLSFGEQHRVALASVLAPRPQILLLDEPFSGLDLGQRHRLLRILAGLRESYAATVLIASHDPLPDSGWADRTISLENVGDN